MLSPETGIDAWLRYAALPSELLAKHKIQYSSIAALTSDEKSPVSTAGKELQDGFQKMLGQKVEVTSRVDKAASSAVIVGTLEDFASAGVALEETPTLKEDGFYLNTKGPNVHIAGQNERGALYGAFEYLSMLAQGDFEPRSRVENPSAPIRYANEWDNLDGSIERGYGGLSIFFKDNKVLEDLTRVKQYARLISSIRLNGSVVNNVNSSAALLSDENLKGLGRIADTMRPYGIRMGLALFFDTPRGLAGLSTSDPLDPDVITFWNNITAKIYKVVPDMMGYTIKANSEGQPGPLTYGRTLADAANMFGRALKPHGDGIVMYRAFVYDHKMDEKDLKNDRANAAVDYFDGLDEKFDDNVLVQIKFGPIDFQIREPASPLLAKLRKTGAMIEFMVCQEYNGQQTHFVYQAPQWKEILDFDFKEDGKPSLVRDILSGERFGWKQSGYSAVVNIGDDPTWIGSHLSMSNLYAYGRLAWSPTDDTEEILRDWIRLTFGHNQLVMDTIVAIGMESWPTYEDYSGNLGIQTLADIIGIHFGPGPGNMDGNGWGQWTRADDKAIGMDRTVATGTGYAGQYPPEVAKVFENIETIPDDLLLWFHHVPYTHRLKSGKTVIQHFYDCHYRGSANAQTWPVRWEKLKGLIDDSRFEHTAFRLAFQAGHSIVWRDSINNFYHDKSGVHDEQGRVGNYKWRIEAEAMDLKGYKPIDVKPKEAASGGLAIVTTSNTEPGTATSKPLEFPSGVYSIAANYYDHLGGQSKFELFLNDKSIGKWTSDLETKLGHNFSKFVDGHSATRITFPGIEVNKGDVIKVVGYPDGNEFAPLDYVSVLPEGVVD